MGIHAQRNVDDMYVHAQLYVYDAELESTQRFQNMRFPGSTTNAQKSVLKQVLKIAQNVIHEHNPYVQDFKQIIEMTDDDAVEGLALQVLWRLLSNQPSGGEMPQSLEPNLPQRGLSPHFLQPKVS